MNKFIPKKYKHIKLQKRLKYKTNSEKKHLDLKLGTLGLKVISSGQITAEILESIRRVIIRKIKKIGKIIFYVHPNIPLTKKPLGVRMGKGAGSLDKWIVPVKKGKIIIELINVPLSLGLLVLKAASYKLPMKTKIIK